MPCTSILYRQVSGNFKSRLSSSGFKLLPGCPTGNCTTPVSKPYASIIPGSDHIRDGRPQLSEKESPKPDAGYACVPQHHKRAGAFHGIEHDRRIHRIMKFQHSYILPRKKFVALDGSGRHAGNDVFLPEQVAGSNRKDDVRQGQVPLLTLLSEEQVDG